MMQKNTISEELKIAIINYLSGKWDECDSRLLTSWLEEDDKNSKLFGQLTELWEAGKMARREKDFDTNRAWNLLESKINKNGVHVKKYSVWVRFSRYAAIYILAFTLGGTGYYLLQKQGQSVFSSLKTVEYSAPYGSKTNLKLLDGTLVRLNAGTTIKYNQGFGIKNRDVELSGEAFFEVAKDKNLPFVVNAKEISVQALGTRFNVKAYPEENTIETFLLEGSVNVHSQQKDMILKPYQKHLFNTSTDDFSVSVLKDASDVSWFSDRWVIKNSKLDELAKLLQRRYNIDFTFKDEQIKTYKFGGTIKDETIEQVLTAITLSAPLKYKISNNHVTLTIDETKLENYRNILK